MESSLEKELREWRENRGREMDALTASREQLFPIQRTGGRTGGRSRTQNPLQTPSFNKGGRRVRVNGQEVLVVSKARRPLPS